MAVDDETADDLFDNLVCLSMVRPTVRRAQGLFSDGDGGAGNKIVASGTRRVPQAGSNEGGGVIA